MRARLILLPMFFYAAPAFAQASASAREPAPRLSQGLSAPATAQKLSDAMERLSTALLELKVGDLHAALEGRKPAPGERDLTVRDLARRADPDFDQELQRQVAEARPKMEQAIRSMNEALPRLTRDLQSAQKSLERAIANMPDPNYPRR